MRTIRGRAMNFFLLYALVLSACGGGGGAQPAGVSVAPTTKSSGTPQSPTPSASSTPAQTPTPSGSTLENWPMFGHDPARSGVDTGDTILTTSNVSKLVAKWQIALGQVADSTPILLANVSVQGATTQVLYITAKNGETFAVNASSGKVLWTYQTSGTSPTQSTPVADPSGTSIYVPGIDGKIHKLNAATGAEITGSGFPATLTPIPSTEKDASSLNLANGYLYATTSGYYGDAPYYDGHVIAVDLSSGAETIFNSLCSNITTFVTSSSTCSNGDSGIWARGGAVVDPDPAMNGAVFVATGNGLYDGVTNFGDSVLSLTSNLSLISWYTPSDYTTLQDDDTDLGSTSPTLLPRQSTSTTPLMLVQGGKDSILRLLNRNSLPGVSGELQTINLPDRLYATPAVWTSTSGTTWIFFGLPSQIDGYELETNGSGVSSLVPGWTASDGTTSGEGTSPVVSNGIVFVAMDGAIYALAATTGTELWSSTNSGVGKTIGPVHWQSPIVVNGWVYCADQNGNLTAFGLP
ncbi:MAG TPA: PQQ-binding-like beta-propeller repeat protein [Candidatus Acidoferrales bacterium]|nr:PQQ-binding-like beta-propeller repeat protein [Candidatus Acidoferrales bacterium]